MSEQEREREKETSGVVGMPFIPADHKEQRDYVYVCGCALVCVPLCVCVCVPLCVCVCVPLCVCYHATAPLRRRSK